MSDVDKFFFSFTCVYFFFLELKNMYISVIDLFKFLYANSCSFFFYVLIGILQLLFLDYLYSVDNFTIFRFIFLEILLS